MSEGSSLLGRWLLAGLGLAALTREKAEELLQDLVRRGEITRDEATRLGQEIRERALGQRSEWRQRLDEEGQRFWASAGVATRAELEELRRKVAALEERLDRQDTVQ